MTGFNVVDRSNVTASQPQCGGSTPIRFGMAGWDTRPSSATTPTAPLPSGSVIALSSTSSASIPRFRTFQMPGSGRYSAAGASAWSWLKLSGLYFVNPSANRTAYLGGGLSYGGQRFGRRQDFFTTFSTSNWEGRGLQSELTAGYELARATSLRLFVQADAVFPFYHATSETYYFSMSRIPSPAITVDRRYAPSFGVSIGLGR